MAKSATPEPFSSVLTIFGLVDNPQVYWNVDDYMQYCEPGELEMEDLAYDRVFLLIPGTIQNHKSPNSEVAARRASIEDAFSDWAYPFMFAAGDHITGLFVHTNGMIPHRLAVIVKDLYEAVTVHSVPVA
jgi:hypothetical protein